MRLAGLARLAMCGLLFVGLGVASRAHAQSMFTHQITLKLPKGAGGMQPDLALSYEPSSGNGQLGMGWQLTGLSQITRVNYGEGVRYAGGDAYAHSAIGILVRQSDGSYRSKMESFTKLVPSGSCGDGPCSWVAYDRTGVAYHYGTTTDSRSVKQASSAVRTWALAKAVDLFGSSYEVSYINDSVNGVLYPSLITYTKGPGLSTYRSVELVYGARDDVERGYEAGALELTNRRLTWINVRSSVTAASPSGTTIRKYRLDYEYGSTTGRSHLIAVQEYGLPNGGIETTLPAQTLGWQHGSEANFTIPDLMTSVSNGLGGAVTIKYSPAPSVPNAVITTSTAPAPGIPNSMPQPLVRKVTTSDGRGGSYSTSYNYYDARVYPGTIPNQRNLGFSSIETVDDQSGQKTKTYFRQDPPYEGRASQVDLYGARGQLVRQTLYSYDLVNPSTGTDFVREWKRTVKEYELGVLAFTQTTTNAFDSYGNVSVMSNDADGLANVTVTTTYSNDPVSWILGRIVNIRTTSGGVTVGEVQNTWNNNTITAKSEWLNTAGPSGAWLTTSITYDANGNLFTVTEPANEDGLVRKTTTEFDATYRAYPAVVTNALNQTLRRAYNDDGLVTSATNANNHVTTTEYDSFGRKSKETRPDGGDTIYSYVGFGDPYAQYTQTTTRADNSIGPQILWKREYFDGSGFKYRVMSNSDCGSDKVSVWHGPYGWSYRFAIVETQKDYAGRPYKSSQPYCSGDAPVWATTLYDDAGRKAYIQTPDTPNNKQISFTYGTAASGTPRPDNLPASARSYVGEVDQNFHETRKYFDARQNVVAVVDAAGQLTSYGYDSLRRLTSVTLPDSSTTSFTYDSLTRRTSSTAPLGSATALTTFLYDPSGNLRTVSAGGKTITFVYDALNRVVVKQPTGETAVGYTYDELAMTNGVGRLTTVVDPSGTTEYSYEPNGELRGFVKRIDGKQFSQTFTYDLAGRVTRMTYPDGSYADYTFTNGGNLSKLSLNGATIGDWDAHIPYDSKGNYDASGRATIVTYGNLVGTNYTYDSMGHMTRLSTSKGSAMLQDLTYDWYSLPNTGGLNVGAITDNRTNKISVGVGCTQTPGCNTDETQSYTYDQLGRLTAASGVWGTKPYVYNSVGNPTTFGGVITRTLNFTGQQVTSGTGLANVLYDALGNMLHREIDGATWDYTWTAEGRLASATKNGAAVPTAQMIYDTDGNRVKKVFTPLTGSSVTTFYIDQAYEKRTYGDGSPERHTINLFAHGQLIASVTTVGNIVTASADHTSWRAEWAMGSLYSASSPRGALQKAAHASLAFVAHPLTRQWFAPVAFALVAASLVIALIVAMRRRGFARAIPAPVRVASLSVALVFGLAACSGKGVDSAVTSTRSPALVGDTTSGLPGGTLFYHRNQINSSAVITNATGDETTRIVYLPFGEISQPNSSGQDVATSKFTGKEYDEETGLYYYGARYYDPATGRFVSADSVIPSWTDGQAYNRYSYVKNNPIAYVDPSGHAFEFVGKALRTIADATAIVRGVAQAARWLGNTAAAGFHRFGAWVGKTDARLRRIPVVGGLLHTSFVWSAYVMTGGLGLPAWASADPQGMARGVATAGIIAASAMLSVASGGIASPSLYIAANAGIGFASGFTAALVEGASLRSATLIGLISGAIAGGIAAISVAGNALKALEQAERVKDGATVLEDGNFIPSGGNEPTSPLGPVDQPWGEQAANGKPGFLGRLGMKVKPLQNWGWAHDGLVRVLGVNNGLGLLSLMTQPLGATMGLVMTPGSAGALGWSGAT
jgi:RHS repeat-associated protein